MKHHGTPNNETGFDDSLPGYSCLGFMFNLGQRMNKLGRMSHVLPEVPWGLSTLRQLSHLKLASG